MSHLFLAVPLPSKNCAIWPTIRGYLTCYAPQGRKGLVRYYFLDGFAMIRGTRLSLSSVVVLPPHSAPMAVRDRHPVKQITFGQHYNGIWVCSHHVDASGFQYIVPLGHTIIKQTNK